MKIVKNNRPKLIKKNGKFFFENGDFPFSLNSNYYSYKKYFSSTNRYVVMKGSAGAGKSYAVADKLLYEIKRQDMMKGTPLKILVLRKTMPSLKRRSMYFFSTTTVSDKEMTPS